MAWPTEKTDWMHNLTEARNCVIKIINAITDHQPVYLISHRELNMSQFSYPENIKLIISDYDDTWTRDYIGITTFKDHIPIFNNFQFNGWGQKFDYKKDNAVNEKLLEEFNLNIENHNFILEGGAIDCNGAGVLLTTQKCLLNPNRNGTASKKDIEIRLRDYLGISEIIWLENGHIPGDDTDGHIDTLARFAPNNTILYAKNQSTELTLMEKELLKFKSKFNLIPISTPLNYQGQNGEFLPATHLNFLITNKKVIVPTYNCKEDDAAIAKIQYAFPTRKVIGINATELIKQNGSIHCITMQIPKFK